MPLTFTLRRRGPLRLLCRLRLPRRDLVLVASATPPRLRALTVLRAAPPPAHAAPPDRLPAA